MGTRVSKTIALSGAKHKGIRAARIMDPGADSKLVAKTWPDRPSGGLVAYDSKGQTAHYAMGVYDSGKKAKPHGYLTGGGTRVIKTGSAQVVKPVSGRPLF